MDGDPGFTVRDRRWWASPDPESPSGVSDRQDGSPERQPSYVQKLEGEIERLVALVAEKDQRARESAVIAREAGDELERAKQRIHKDAAKDLEQKKRQILLGFLEVLDDLDRALQATPLDAHNAAVVEGVELVRKRFVARLGEFGVTHLPAAGERFDPRRHEALSMVGVTDPHADGAIVGVIREGYLIGDDTLRPAGVAVGKLTR